MGPPLSQRPEYFYGPFNSNFSASAFVNIYEKPKTMGKFDSGLWYLNANTKCCLRAQGSVRCALTGQRGSGKIALLLCHCSQHKNTLVMTLHWSKILVYTVTQLKQSIFLCTMILLQICGVISI